MSAPSIITRSHTFSAGVTSIALSLGMTAALNLPGPATTWLSCVAIMIAGSVVIGFMAERHKPTSGYGLPAATVIAHSFVELFSAIAKQLSIGNMLNRDALTLAVVFVSVYLCQALMYRILHNRKAVARFFFSILLLALGILIASAVHITTIDIMRNGAAAEVQSTHIYD